MPCGSRGMGGLRPDAAAALQQKQQGTHRADCSKGVFVGALLPARIS